MYKIAKVIINLKQLTIFNTTVSTHFQHTHSFTVGMTTTT